jgi:GNAT superfamily N-acetyltransferase
VTSIEISVVGFGDRDSQQMIAAALADLRIRYNSTSGDDTPVAAAEFDLPAGCFLLARADGVPAGCGGWRTLAADPTVAEIKRMYTAPEHRGRGVASAVLRALEATARDVGRTRLVLETGNRQPEAIALYRKLGYEQIPNFGYYKDYPGCVSFGRRL